VTCNFCSTLLYGKIISDNSILSLNTLTRVIHQDSKIVTVFSDNILDNLMIIMIIIIIIPVIVITYFAIQ